MINNNDFCEDICLVYLFIYFYLLDIREYKILFCVDYTVYLFKCNISSFINEAFHFIWILFIYIFLLIGGIFYVVVFIICWQLQLQ